MASCRLPKRIYVCIHIELHVMVCICIFPSPSKSRWTYCRDDGPNTELGLWSGPFDVSFDSRGRRALIDLRKCCEAGEVVGWWYLYHICAWQSWSKFEKAKLDVNVRCVLAFESGMSSNLRLSIWSKTIHVTICAHTRVRPQIWIRRCLFWVWAVGGNWLICFLLNLYEDVGGSLHSESHVVQTWSPKCGSMLFFFLKCSVCWCEATKFVRCNFAQERGFSCEDQLQFPTLYHFYDILMNIVGFQTLQKSLQY